MFLDQCSPRSKSMYGKIVVQTYLFQRTIDKVALTNEFLNNKTNCSWTHLSGSKEFL